MWTVSIKVCRTTLIRGKNFGNEKNNKFKRNFNQKHLAKVSIEKDNEIP